MRGERSGESRSRFLYKKEKEEKFFVSGALYGTMKNEQVVLYLIMYFTSLKYVKLPIISQTEIPCSSAADILGQRTVSRHRHLCWVVSCIFEV